nr:MAG TPA: hypothetical protein [Caudoviricetes sp.]
MKGPSGKKGSRNAFLARFGEKEGQGSGRKFRE